MEWINTTWSVLKPFIYHLDVIQPWWLDRGFYYFIPIRKSFLVTVPVSSSGALDQRQLCFDSARRHGHCLRSVSSGKTTGWAFMTCAGSTSPFCNRELKSVPECSVGVWCRSCPFEPSLDTVSVQIPQALFQWLHFSLSPSSLPESHPLPGHNFRVVLMSGIIVSTFSTIQLL